MRWVWQSLSELRLLIDFLTNTLANCVFDMVFNSHHTTKQCVNALNIMAMTYRRLHSQIHTANINLTLQQSLIHIDFPLQQFIMPSTSTTPFNLLTTHPSHGKLILYQSIPSCGFNTLKQRTITDRFQNWLTNFNSLCLWNIHISVMWILTTFFFLNRTISNSLISFHQNVCIFKNLTFQSDMPKSYIYHTVQCYSKHIKFQLNLDRIST